MSREELIQILNIIMSGGSEEKNDRKYSEVEIDRLVRIFEESIPCPYGSDLIFYPDLCGLSDKATSEEIVDFALNYKEEN